tara:strand:+ start:882 stop:1052 length:171 start_codon:yes stop_codon:yes gene_type:complete
MPSKDPAKRKHSNPRYKFKKVDGKLVPKEEVQVVAPQSQSPAPAPAVASEAAETES